MQSLERGWHCCSQRLKNLSHLECRPHDQGAQLHRQRKKYPCFEGAQRAQRKNYEHFTRSAKPHSNDLCQTWATSKELEDTKRKQSKLMHDLLKSSVVEPKLARKIKSILSSAMDAVSPVPQSALPKGCTHERTLICAKGFAKTTVVRPGWNRLCWTNTIPL